MLLSTMSILPSVPFLHSYFSLYQFFLLSIPRKLLNTSYYTLQGFFAPMNLLQVIADTNIVCVFLLLVQATVTLR